MEDKERRNIKFAFIEVPNFFKNEESREIDEDALVSEIRLIKPQMTVMVICYSHFLDLKSLLERAGLFPTMRLNRYLNSMSNGQILTVFNLPLLSQCNLYFSNTYFKSNQMYSDMYRT